MGDNKALPILAAIGLVLFLPLLIVLAMIAGGLSSMEAVAQDCGTTSESKSFAWPTDKHEVSEGWSDADSEGNSHSGTDFDVDEGSKVYAAADGKVVSTAGHEVQIEHEKGVQTRYKYLQDIKVHTGDKVKRGDQIATSGSGNEGTPGLSGSHLHFELWIDKKGDGNFENTKPEADSFGDDDSAASSGSCGCGGGLVGNSNAEKAFNYFASHGYSKEQAAGIVGNMIHESGVEPARKEGTAPGVKTNPSDVVTFGGGWGIVQWTPAGKMIRPSRASGVDDATIASLEYQLDFLNKQLNGQTDIPESQAGSAIKAAHGVEEAAVAFGRYYERFLGSDNLSNSRYTERKATAREVFNTYGGGTGGATGTGGDAAAPCGGNIVAVAKSLAWPEPGHGRNKEDAKPEYQAALPKYNSTSGDRVWSDCGRFVATVMRMSGADPDYPMVYTPTQENYLRTSGKYDVFDSISMKDLQPGDIFIGPGHTYMFVGSIGNGYNSVAGSLGDHVPQAGNAYDVGIPGGFAVARLKKK